MPKKSKINEKVAIKAKKKVKFEESGLPPLVSVRTKDGRWLPAVRADEDKPKAVFDLGIITPTQIISQPEKF